MPGAVSARVLGRLEEGRSQVDCFVGDGFQSEAEDSAPRRLGRGVGSHIHR